MRATRLAVLVAIAACGGPETTSFRTTDRGDNSDRAGPPAAAYDVRIAERATANVHVWTNGGYIGASDEPMTHVGFEIRNTGVQPIVFDAESLRVVAFDRNGAPLPPVEFVAVTPLGPAQVAIAGNATVMLDGYFKLPVRPRVVDSMRVRWSLRAGPASHDEITTFIRDDAFPVADPPKPPELPGVTRANS